MLTESIMQALSDYERSFVIFTTLAMCAACIMPAFVDDDIGDDDDIDDEDEDAEEDIEDDEVDEIY